MRRQGARIKSHLQDRVDTALTAGGLGLATLAFIVVLREGIETALFLFTTVKATTGGTGGTWGQVTGALLGLGTAVVLGYLLYRGGIRLNLRTFFKVTGALILVVAAGLFAFSLHELQEAGFLPFLEQTAFDISPTLSDEAGVGGVLRALIGYQANPTLLELFGWLGYLGVTGWLFFRPARAVAPAPVAASPSR
jgi:high-affinity iron transporter